MKAQVVTLLIAILLMTTGGTAALSLTASDDAGEPQRYIVGFHTMPAERSTYAGERVVAVDGDLRFFVVLTKNPLQLQARAQLDERVRYVEYDDPHYATLFFVPNDAKYNDPGHWGSKKIGAEAAWDRTLGSTAIKVGMLDSGLNRNHEEYAGQSRVLQGYDFVNGDTDPNDESACSYHGTHTTGTAGATINNGKGIAGMSQHTILPVKAFYASFFGCSGSTTAIVDGLKYIADQGSHISSNSWGGGTSTAINDAIKYAHGKGTIHVAAAGNSGPCTNCVSEPWKTNKDIVIVVASTTSSDGQSSFSSEGPEVDVAAPGSDILSTTSGTSGYSALSGTSMATPHVAGAAALIKALQPGWTFADVDNRLKTTAVDLGASGKDDDFGYGRINADAATNGLGGGGTTYQCNDGIDNDGDGYVDYPADPGCSSSTDNDEYNAPPPPPSGTVYAENFDDGSAQGWSKSSSSDLWHLESGCVADYSPEYKLAWTRASYCDYNTGSRVTNWARSGAIDLSGYSSATLKFVHRFDIEQYSGGAYDKLRVQVSADGSTWATLKEWNSQGADVTSWTAVSFGIDGYAGGTVYLRFWTDTVDSYSNNHAGWYIDNIEVTAA